MKESVAKLKWCPMTRVRILDGSANRWTPLYQSSDLAQESKCIGSGCMMWEQWPLVENNQYVTGPDGKVLMGDSGDCGLKSKDLVCNGQ